MHRETPAECQVASASGSSELPSLVPAAYAPAIAGAAQRWSVSGALLAAQLYAHTCLPLDSSAVREGRSVLAGVVVPPPEGFRVVRRRQGRGARTGGEAP